MEREEADEKARGKWRWHSLAIDRSVGRSAAQKGERRPLAIDRSSFGSTGRKKKTEKEARGQMKQWPFATVSKKNERQVAMALACDRSVYGSIGHTKRRKKAACDRSIVFWIDRRRDIRTKWKRQETSGNDSHLQWLYIVNSLLENVTTKPLLCVVVVVKLL